MLNVKLQRVDELSSEERTAIRAISLLQPPVPNGHLYLYRADVMACVEHHRMRNKLRSYLSDRVRQLKESNNATILSILLIVAVEIGSLAITLSPKIHFSNYKQARDLLSLILDIAGNMSVAFGALWTASGAIISRHERKKLFAEDADIRMTVDFLKSTMMTASNRASQGVVLLVLGSAMVLAKVWFWREHQPESCLTMPTMSTIQKTITK